MFYEYRRYDVVHGRMEEVKTRFAESTIPMWKESGIEPVAFFEPRIGNPNILHYFSSGTIWAGGRRHGRPSG